MGQSSTCCGVGNQAETELRPYQPTAPGQAGYGNTDVDGSNLSPQASTVMAIPKVAASTDAQAFIQDVSVGPLEDVAMPQVAQPLFQEV